MKAFLLGSEDIELRALSEPGLEVENRDPEAHYGAVQMFAVSLAMCTGAVLLSYAEQAEAGVDTLAIRVRWQYAEKPFRIGAIDMAIRWPELPASRLEAARRAAAECTLHHTLEQPPRLTTELSRGGAA